MLPRKLQEIKSKLQSKASYRRTDSENELLQELNILEEVLTNERKIQGVFDSVEKASTRITSGPSGSCPCCGKE